MFLYIKQLHWITEKKNDASDNVELTYVAPVISTADHV